MTWGYYDEEQDEYIESDDNIAGYIYEIKMNLKDIIDEIDDADKSDIDKHIHFMKMTINTMKMLKREL